jgi:hypothetical protein
MVNSLADSGHVYAGLLATSHLLPSKVIPCMHCFIHPQSLSEKQQGMTQMDFMNALANEVNKGGSMQPVINNLKVWLPVVA